MEIERGMAILFLLNIIPIPLVMMQELQNLSCYDRHCLLTFSIINPFKSNSTNPNIVGVEKYQAKLKVRDEECDIIITVKHHLDGRRYYDHGYMK